MFVAETSSKLLTGSRSLFWENGEGNARVFLENVAALWAIWANSDRSIGMYAAIGLSNVGY